MNAYMSSIGCIGVIASLPEEMERLKAEMRDPEKTEYAHREFLTGYIGEKKITAVIGGAGKVNAASAAQALIDLASPSAIIHTGVAGSLCDEAPHLSIVISTSLVYHDTDMYWLENCPPFAGVYPADEDMSARLAKAAEKYGKAVPGRMATGDRFISDKAVKDDIRARTGAVCVDMETCATAHVALMAGIPYCAVKCISDMSDESHAGSFEEFLTRAADAAAGTVADMLRM